MGGIKLVGSPDRNEFWTSQLHTPRVVIDIPKATLRGLGTSWYILMPLLMFDA